jgi:hypothetical protein
VAAASRSGGGRANAEADSEHVGPA